MPANPNWGEVLTTTINSRSRKLADNVTSNNLLLLKMKQSGRIKTFSGGVKIIQEIDWNENAGFSWYNPYDLLSTAPTDSFTAAEFDIKLCAVPIVISGLEMLQNSGKEKMISLLESRVQNAERTMMNRIQEALYSDGTLFGGRAPGGLQLLVSDNPAAGTVGNISRVNYPFWRNVSYDATTDGGAAATEANIQRYMRAVYLRLTRGTDAPNLIVADDNYYNLFAGSLQAQQRFQDASEAEAGFRSLKFMGASVYSDGGVGAVCPVNHMYFLNTNYLFYRPHADRNMTAITGELQAINQDATVKHLGWAGNFTASNLALQGVLKD